MYYSHIWTSSVWCPMSKSSLSQLGALSCSFWLKTLIIPSMALGGVILHLEGTWFSRLKRRKTGSKRKKGGGGVFPTYYVFYLLHPSSKESKISTFIFSFFYLIHWVSRVQVNLGHLCFNMCLPAFLDRGLLCFRALLSKGTWLLVICLCLSSFWLPLYSEH